MPAIFMKITSTSIIEALVIWADRTSAKIPATYIPNTISEILQVNAYKNTNVDHIGTVMDRDNPGVSLIVGDD